MPKCPKCQAEYPDGTEYCPKDGEALELKGEDLGVAATAYGPADVRDTSQEDETSLPGANVEKRESSPSYVSVGQMIGGVYRVIDELGVGGMGVVYRVEHINLQKEFALKVLGQIAQDHPDAVERFRQEAVSASHIEHDNIVDIITLDQTPEGNLFIVMELLKGESLSDAIRKSAPMELERALSITYQICQALHAAHEAGIIHRDLKPENVHLVPKGDAEFAKILDFGISKIHDAENNRVRITKTGHVLGTPLYMSPEQAKGESSLDRRVDIYSLGVILYEMLQGAPPFEGENYFQLIWKHTNEEAPPLEGDFSDALKDAVAKALSKDPRDRFETMLEFEQAIEQAVPSVPPPTFLVDYRPSLSAPPARGVTAAKQSGFNPRLLLVLAAAVGVITLGGLVGFINYGPPTSGQGVAIVVPATTDASTSDSSLRHRKNGSDVERGDSSPGDASASRQDEPEFIEVSIASTPVGATLFIDDERIGTTPYNGRRPPTKGEVTLKLIKRGFRTAQKQVSLAEDLDLTIQLTRRVGGGSQNQGGSGDPQLPIKTVF